MLPDSWFTVEKIDETTYALSEYGHWEQVHSYLLVGTECAALIDTGLGIGDIGSVVRQLTRLRVKVLTTHVHWDHIGGHRAFEIIYVHEQEEHWLRQGIPGMSAQAIRNQVGKDPTHPFPKGFELSAYEPFRGAPSVLVKDGDSLDLGGRELTFIHTPGHSPGHVCIYEAKRGYLFAGDLIYQGTLFAFYPTTDPLQFVHSVAKLNQIKDIVAIFPGHYRLGLNRVCLTEVHQACQRLLRQGLAHHGTGVHEFGDFAIHF